MDKQIIRKWLTSTDIPLSVISRKTNISRATLYSWKDENTEIRDKNAYKILDVYADKIEQNTEEGGEKLRLHERIIELQERVIHQQDEIVSLKKRSKTPIVDKSFESFAWDFKCTHTFDENVTLLNYVRYVNIDAWRIKLGYSKEEFKDVLTSFKPRTWSDVEQNNAYDTWNDKLRGLVTERTLEKWTEQSALLATIMKFKLQTSTLHLLPMIIEYIHKDGSIVKAMSYAQVNFELFTTDAKIKFLTD